MTELKRCPFCGGEAGIDEDKYECEVNYYASCSKCVAETGSNETKSEAIDCWNKRVDLVSENDEGLLSCPCCGGNASVNEFDIEERVFYCVMCDKCQLHTQGSDKEQEVVVLWNERA